MGDNIANQNNLSYGPYGTIQLSDGAGLFTGTDLINVSVLNGILYATQFVGDGGLLSNIHGGGGGGGNVGFGNPGEVAYYTGNYNVEGLSEITVDSGTGLINIHSNSHATNVTLTSVIFDVSDTVDANAAIDYYPTLQAVCDTGNTYTGAVSIQGIATSALVETVVFPGSTTFNCALGSTFYVTGQSTNFVANFQNISLSSGQSRTIKIILVQGSSPVNILGFQVNGVSCGLVESSQTGQANSVNMFEILIVRTVGGYVALAETPKYFS
jgi:hypothetical protein